MSVSATTPWPGNDASPWMRIGNATAGSWTPDAGRAVGLLGARDAFDDRVDSLEVARVRGEEDLASPASVLAAPDGAQVVLDVAACAFRRRCDRLDRSLALELAENLRVRPPDDVREDVEPTAMRHSDHDLVRAGLDPEPDRLVEHRNHHVEPLDRELLLPEERPLEVVLEALDLRQTLEEPSALFAAQRLAVAAGLDRMAEPDAFLVVRDVLDLIRDRPAVDLAELRQDVGERLALDPDAQHRCRNAGLELRRQRRLEQLSLERRVADGIRAERIEVRGQMPVHADRLDQRHRRGDASDQQVVSNGLRGRRRNCRDLHRLLRRSRFWRRFRLSGSTVLLQVLDQPGEAGQRVHDRRVAALEQRPPLLRHRLGILEVLLEERLGIAHVQPVDITHAHLRFVLPPPLPPGAASVRRSGCSSEPRTPFRSATQRSRR